MPEFGIACFYNFSDCFTGSHIISVWDSLCCFDFQAAAFWRCMNTAEADEDADDPGALAAVGCLRAISTILESVSRLPHLFVQIEPTLLPIMRRMLTTDGQGKYMTSSLLLLHLFSLQLYVLILFSSVVHQFVCVVFYLSILAHFIITRSYFSLSGMVSSKTFGSWPRGQGPSWMGRPFSLTKRSRSELRGLLRPPISPISLPPFGYFY